jgi:hypothetical protein
MVGHGIPEMKDGLKNEGACVQLEDGSTVKADQAQPETR